MIIKPMISARIFSATAGLTLLITGCSMSALVFPVGLIILCIALPLAVFSFGFAFGAVQTCVDDDGVFQRNFFFMTKKFLWNEIENAKVEVINFNRVDSSGWTSRGTRTHLLLKSKDKKIYVNSSGTGPENWWDEVKKLAKEKLGERLEN